MYPGISPKVCRALHLVCCILEFDQRYFTPGIPDFDIYHHFLALGIVQKAK